MSPTIVMLIGWMAPAPDALDGGGTAMRAPAHPPGQAAQRHAHSPIPRERDAGLPPGTGSASWVTRLAVTACARLRQIEKSAAEPRVKPPVVDHGQQAAVARIVESIARPGRRSKHHRQQQARASAAQSRRSRHSPR